MQEGVADHRVEAAPGSIVQPGKPVREPRVEVGQRIRAAPRPSLPAVAQLVDGRSELQRAGGEPVREVEDGVDDGEELVAAPRLGGVRPVDVFEHEHDPAVGLEAVEERRNGQARRERPHDPQLGPVQRGRVRIVLGMHGLDERDGPVRRNDAVRRPR